MKTMRKSVLIISLLAIMIQLLSCSSFEIQFRPQMMKSRPKKILIGTFENRTPQYNPFIVKDFRDSLRFEFFKLGYDAELSAMEGSKITGSDTCEGKKVVSSNTKEPQNSETNPIAASKNAIQLCCEKYSSDLLITGSISILETDELTDSKASTLILASIYNNSGELVGEAHYIGSDQMEDAKSIKNISKRFADNIHSKLRKLRYSYK